MSRFRSTFAVVGFGLVVTTALPAQACQLICVRTQASYNGNLGGMTGANAKCHAEFPGFKAAKGTDVLFSILPEGGDLWDNIWNLAPSSGSHCSNWTSTSGSGAVSQYCYNKYGGSSFNGTSYIPTFTNSCTGEATGDENRAPSKLVRGASDSCNNPKRLLCCNI